MTTTNDASEDAARAIRELGLASKLEALPEDEARDLYEAIVQRFATSTQVRWSWEHLRNPGVSRQLEGHAFERLAEIVPSTNVDLLYVPGSDEDVAAAYRGRIDAIAAVIGDCAYHEYVISPLGLEWLVCENHHGVVIAVGEPVESRLRALSQAPPDAAGILIQELDAHDSLVERCARGELTWTEFEKAYDNFYVRYPLDGHESDALELSLLEKHADRVALHRDIWEQVLTKVTLVSSWDGDGDLIGPDEAVARLRDLLSRHR